MSFRLNFTMERNNKLFVGIVGPLIYPVIVDNNHSKLLVILNVIEVILNV